MHDIKLAFTHKTAPFFLCRVHLVPLAQEAPQDPQEPMALRDLLEELETPVLLEKR